MSFSRIEQLVDFNAGHVSVAFLAQKADSRQDIATGREEGRNGGQLYVESLRKAARGHWSARLFSLLPTSLLGAAATGYTGSLQYIHCELAMFLTNEGIARYDGRDVLAITVTVEGVVIKPRGMKPEYEWIHVACPPTNMRAMLHWCCSHHKKPYSLSRLSNVAVAPGRAQDREWFCVQLVMGALRFTPHPVCHENAINKATVDDLYDLLTSSKSIAPATVHKFPRALVQKTLSSAAPVKSRHTLSEEARRAIERGI